MIEDKNGKLSLTRKPYNNKILRPILAILVTVLILGTAFSGVSFVRAQPTRDKVWDSGDVRQMVIFMAEHLDPITNDWDFPAGSEDRAIADEMLRVMTEIQNIREKYPYSLLGLGEYFIDIFPGKTEAQIGDGALAVVSLLGNTQFQDDLLYALHQSGDINIFSGDNIPQFQDMLIGAADDIDNEFINPNPGVRNLGSKSAQLTLNKASTIQKLGAKISLILNVADIAVILISHYFVIQEIQLLVPSMAFPTILQNLIDYEIGGGFDDFGSDSVEHMKILFDVFGVLMRVIGSIAGAMVLGLAGASIGSVVPAVGTVVGGAIGAFIGAIVGGYLAEQAVRTLYAYLTQTEIIRQPTLDKFERYYYEKNVKVEIVDIWSFGNDNYVPVGELVYVKIRNGPLAAPYIVGPSYSDWTIFAAPNDPIEIAAFILNPLATLIGTLRDNTRTITLQPYEEKTVWFLITPFGLTHEFPYLTKYSYDNINFIVSYQHATFTEPFLKAQYGEAFTSAGLGPAFNIQVHSNQLYYLPGDTVSVDIIIENIGTEEGIFTIGISFRSLNPVETFDGASITPSDEATLAPGQIQTFHAERSFPLDGPQGQYQIAVNCWEDPYTVLYPDNLEWQDIFLISTPITGSYMHIVEQSPAELDLYDPANQHVGFSEGYLGATYSHDPITGDRIIEVYDLLNGTYTIELTGILLGSYTLEITISYFGVNIYQKVYTNTIDIGEIHTILVIVSFDETGQLIITSTAPEIPYEPQPPTADAGNDITTEEGKATHFDGTGSDVPEGRITKYEWDFNEDGIFDATGPRPSYIWYDDYIGTVLLQITVEIETISTDDEGNDIVQIITLTDTDTMTVTVLNLDPTASIDRGYMYVDFTLRGAGEKWHNVQWDLYVTDEGGESDGMGDGGQIGYGELIAHLEIERFPGDPDSQSDTVYDVYIDSERIYYSVATYYPYEDGMPINGQPHGSNPCWIILTFEDGSFEKIHHNFNEVQSIVRNSDHWVHKEPWYLDFSPWLVSHTWTFEGSTTDQGTDDETFTWDWDDSTTLDVAFYTYRRPDTTTDPYPSPYDREEGNYPVAITDTQYHAYMMEDDYTPELMMTDDDFPADGGQENDGMALDYLDIDAIHSRVITLPDGSVLARK